MTLSLANLGNIGQDQLTWLCQFSQPIFFYAKSWEVSLFSQKGNPRSLKMNKLIKKEQIINLFSASTPLKFAGAWLKLSEQDKGSPGPHPAEIAPGNCGIRGFPVGTSKNKNQSLNWIHQWRVAEPAFIARRRHVVWLREPEYNKRV